MFFLLPPLAALLEVAITATVGTLATLAAHDLYERIAKSDDNADDQ
ncbi:hypothetical protein [Comamonas thiooxydans]|nr:hypothetical protein [Comamonas thiooxydans]